LIFFKFVRLCPQADEDFALIRADRSEGVVLLRLTHALVALPTHYWQSWF